MCSFWNSLSSLIFKMKGSLISSGFQSPIDCHLSEPIALSVSHTPSAKHWNRENLEIYRLVFGTNSRAAR